MSAPTPVIPPPGDNWGGTWQAPPAAVLAYSSIQGRPGLVTGLGVTSIVVASLSILSALWWALMYLPWIMMSTTPAFAPAAAPTAPANLTTAAGSLTQEQADLIAAAMAERQPLKAADQAALAQALMLAELPLAPPADGEWTADHVNQQISYVSSWSDNSSGSVSFSFGGGDITISGASVTINVYNSNGSSQTTVTNGAVTTNSTSTFAPQTAFTGPGRGIIALGLASLLLSLGLAALLLIAGIQTVRGVPSGRVLHLCWAWPKLAAAALAAVANYWFWSASYFAFGAVGTNGVVLGVTGAMFAISIAWPVAVLLILRSRSMRAYYRPD